jgi:hypothetical protein
MMGAFAHKVNLPAFMAGSRSNIDFAPNDGFDSFLAGGLVKLDGAKEIAVIGHRDCLHAGFPNFFHQGRDLVGSIEKTVLGMDVEMDKSVNGRHSKLLPYIVEIV